MTPAAVAARLQRWEETGFARRLWAKDHTLWSPTRLPEITDRLGWLDLPTAMTDQTGAITDFAYALKAAGMRHIVLVGMGGSSLAPEVFQRTFGNAAGYPALIVLDSTHPGAVAAVDAAIDPRTTVFLVSSKSGTTTETLSLFRYFWQRVEQGSSTPGAHFVAITDPDTPLVRLAYERGFRQLFLAPPDVGGRYSALTVFGLVPAALLGVDIRRVLDRARHMAEAVGPSVRCQDSPGLRLGAALGEWTLVGRDKVTFVVPPSLAGLPSWIEQLIAESTGKDGKGIVPIVDEPAGAVDAYERDRVFVHVCVTGEATPDLEASMRALEAAGHPVIRTELADKTDIGQEFFRWEVAVAAAGAVLGIHPFNQPDVQLAKDLAQQAMQKGVGATPPDPGKTAMPDEVAADRRETLAGALRAWLATVRPGDYVGVQAYLAPSSATTAALDAIRQALRDRLRVATTLGYGPRFLHSTGQLHKGGPNTGLFLQIVDDPPHDLAVPETDYTFGALIRAQALGDLAALHQRGRRLVRVDLGRDVVGGLARVAEVLRA
jgi:transaldolase/glucose-6-phosphate isomerase